MLAERVGSATYLMTASRRCRRLAKHPYPTFWRDQEREQGLTGARHVRSRSRPPRTYLDEKHNFALSSEVLSQAGLRAGSVPSSCWLNTKMAFLSPFLQQQGRRLRRTSTPPSSICTLPFPEIMCPGDPRKKLSPFLFPNSGNTESTRDARLRLDEVAAGVETLAAQTRAHEQRGKSGEETQAGEGSQPTLSDLLASLSKLYRRHVCTCNFLADI
eukprot:1150051-Pelagomonas_calceolata.AAC.9